MSNRRHVFVFLPRFADLVREGTKRQTIRPLRKRMPVAGEVAVLRAWSGKPYRSKQERLGERTITEVWSVNLSAPGPFVKNETGNAFLFGRDRDEFAGRDGFPNGWIEMRQWFERMYGLPFGGFVTVWSAVGEGA